MASNVDPQRALVEIFARELAGVIERMTGGTVGCVVADTPEAKSMDGGVVWAQDFAPAAIGPLWVAAEAPAACAIGRYILTTAGIGDVDADAARATYLDLLGNACSTFTRPLGQRFGQAVTCATGREDAVPGIPLYAIELRYDGATARLLARLDGVAAAPETAVPFAEPEAPLEKPALPKTLDLLLDVELPVSVSFGTADLPLKDVVNLTAGSIVELNRTLSEPVDVVVNNCVIARGEVVVVDGNFGVRIQEVVSRQERLRTVG